MRQKGYSLPEISMSLLCIAILIGPVFSIFRSGSKTSLKGISKSDLTLEASRILKQIHGDLKHSVFLWDGLTIAQNRKKEDYFDDTLHLGSEESYELLRFPLHEAVDDAILNTPDSAKRGAIKIKYELKKENPQQLFYTLFRKEGGNPPKPLSKRVNYFEIKMNELSTPRFTWFVTLQLVEDAQLSPNDANVKKLRQTQNDPIGNIARRLRERSKAVQVADFFDVAASDYYTAFRRNWSRRFWKTTVAQPNP